MKTSRPLPRIAAGLTAVVLALAPVAAHADDIDGTPGNDTITGTPGDDDIDAGAGDDDVTGDPDGPPADGGDDAIDGGAGDDTIVGDEDAAGGEVVDGGDDTIEGGDGDDVIRGDGDASPGGTVNGGDDTIEGGDGDDVIQGDGSAVCVPRGGLSVPLLDCGSVNGGDDVIRGGDGNDTIFGDESGFCGFFLDNPFLGCSSTGGDDVLYGEAGHDNLLGGGGSDLLCGGEGENYLLGMAGVDIACAVDDEDTVEAGEENVFDLSANDEELFDEADELSPLLYSIERMNRCTEATIDPLTGVLTYTATRSGSLTYGVTRDGATYTSFADLLITVTGQGLCRAVAADPEDGGPDRGGAAAPASASVLPVVDTAVLPDTGASEHAVLWTVAGLVLLLAGSGTLVGGRRRTPTA